MSRNTLGLLCAFVGIASCSMASAADSSFIGDFKIIKAHASTVPSNGDVNPYGVAVVPQNAGRLQANHVLVSNFNNSTNIQGTGITIVDVSPGDGSVSLFAQINDSSCPGGVGLTTALVVLKSGFVIVGSLPTANMGTTFPGPGCLIVLNSRGDVVESITDASLNGPWDMTAIDMGFAAVLFVTNVLNGIDGIGSSSDAGTVVRINLNVPPEGIPAVTSITTIASGISTMLSSTALVIGPTGIAIAPSGILYVADTVNSRILAITSPSTLSASIGTGTPLPFGPALNGPLGLAIAPNGNIITVNGGDGKMVETTPAGVEVAVKAVDVTGGGAGDLFGLAIRPDGPGIYFVNDGDNTLDWIH